MSYITTVTGKHFDPLSPNEQLIDIVDIAHALSLTCRANGHFRIFYSVAQHSIACAKEAEARGYSPEIVLGCLLHDGSEAYLSDVTRPIKKELSRYLEIEDRLQNMIWAYFIGREPTEEERRTIFEIDDEMLSMEFHQLMPEDINEDYKKLKRSFECAYASPESIEAEYIRLATDTGKRENMQERMAEGVRIAERFLDSKRILFAELKPSDLPERPGVYAIFRRDTEENLYVGRTKNLRQRLYTNHLHGPITNARLKKYLIEDNGEPEVKDLDVAKKYLKDYCYLQFVVEEDIMKRGRLEGLLSYLFHVRYMYKEH